MKISERADPLRRLSDQQGRTLGNIVRKSSSCTLFCWPRCLYTLMRSYARNHREPPCSNTA
ncbi:hypothetical protein ACHAXR_009412 [Thalassiosira sp. AJA248-18]